MQIYLLSFTWGYAQNHRIIFIENDARNTSKHLLEVFLKLSNVLAVSNDFKQIFITNEVKPNSYLKLDLYQNSNYHFYRHRHFTDRCYMGVTDTQFSSTVKRARTINSPEPWIHQKLSSKNLAPVHVMPSIQKCIHASYCGPFLFTYPSLKYP